MSRKTKAGRKFSDVVKVNSEGRGATMVSRRETVQHGKLLRFRVPFSIEKNC